MELTTGSSTSIAVGNGLTPKVMNLLLVDPDAVAKDLCDEDQLLDRSSVGEDTIADHRPVPVPSDAVVQVGLSVY